eukprot:234356-Pelagomonas_calceolata.AAC.1
MSNFEGQQAYNTASYSVGTASRMNSRAGATGIAARGLPYPPRGGLRIPPAKICPPSDRAG